MSSGVITRGSFLYFGGFVLMIESSGMIRRVFLTPSSPSPASLNILSIVPLISSMLSPFGKLPYSMFFLKTFS